MGKRRVEGRAREQAGQPCSLHTARGGERERERGRDGGRSALIASSVRRNEGERMLRLAVNLLSGASRPMSLAWSGFTKNAKTPLGIP